MRFGIAVFPADYAADPATIARLVEERGFESLFVPEHTHIPAGRRTPNPGGGDIPEEFRHTPDPFVVLGAVAACTERLLLGTGICLVVERDPIVTAKALATVDPLAGGGARAEHIAALGRAAAGGGGGPSPVTGFGARPKPEILAGSAEAGVERALLALPSAPAADTLRRLDRYAQLIDAPS